MTSIKGIAATAQITDSVLEVEADDGMEEAASDTQSVDPED